jgi:chromosome segregation ATPase
MKKIFISSVFALVSLFVFGGNTVFAQNQVVQPNAGLTPESNFYFLDKFGEALREFFTFNPEGKAHLQITFASERIAEIRVILETKGVEAKGLEVAQSRLQAHLANAATIVVDQKVEGEDVSRLAKELDDEFDAPKTVLEQAFKAEKRALEAQGKELKGKILEARRAGDTAQVESLVQQLGQVKAQKELLELKEEESEEALEQEVERLEEEMEAKEEAEKTIRETEKEKQEVLDEAAEENVAVPAEAFGEFDSLLAQAKAALTASNFQEAMRLAKQAEKNLDSVEEVIEDLEDAKEKEREAKEEQEETMKEEAKKEVERLEEEQEKAEEGVSKSEEKLREAGDENED